MKCNIKYQRQRKWDSSNMRVLSTKIKRKTATLFKGLCYEQGTTVNAVLRKYINECVAREKLLTNSRV